MNIIVFGGTGGTGRQFIQQAIDAGHSITAFLRNPSALGLEHPQLKVIKGDATNQQEVTEAIKGHDIVVSCLGTRLRGPSTVLAEMAECIVKGMEKNGVKRLLYVASAGIHKEIPGIMGMIVQRLLKNVLVDHGNAFTLLQNSTLDWTVARPMQLTDGIHTGTYRKTVTGVPSKAQKIARADVADFLLKSIQNEEHIKESIGLAY